MKPPGVKDRWDDCGADSQALILGFNQVREHDESEMPRFPWR